jgi:outer membrane biogenesis lipoprotein LolB
MKTSSLFLLPLAALLLAGCQSTNDVANEITMPQLQQNTYLSHAKPPQNF